MKLKLTEIKLNNHHVRLDTYVDSLMVSMKAVGLINPVIVNNKLELISGGRRYTSAKKLGWTYIEATKIEHDSVREELVSIDENLERSPLKGLEWEKAIKVKKDLMMNLGEEYLTNEFHVKCQKKTPSVRHKNDNRGRNKKPEAMAKEIIVKDTNSSASKVHRAIDRQEKSSEQVLIAREEGIISAAINSELVKLNHDEQNKILPLIKKNTETREVKQIVSRALEVNNVDVAVNEAKAIDRAMKLYASIKTKSRALMKVLGHAREDDIRFIGKEYLDLNICLLELHQTIDKFIDFQKGDVV